MTAPDGIFTSYHDDGSGGVEAEEPQDEPEVQQEEKQDEPEEEQEDREPERTRPMAITSYDHSAALTNKNVAAEKAAENKGSEGDSSDGDE